jgi:hypothetical protein
LGIFQIGNSKLPTVILLISASGVARITGVSHQHPAQDRFKQQPVQGKMS